MRYKSICKNDVHELEHIDRIAILDTAEVFDDKKEIEKWLDCDFSTSIVLECNEDNISIIKSQLRELQFEELLFLKHINSIIIEMDEFERKIDSVKEENKALIQEGEKFSEWTIWKKQGEIKQTDGTDKEYEIIVAYNADKEERERNRKEGVLYSYFKTEVLMPFPYLHISIRNSMT